MAKKVNRSEKKHEHGWCCCCGNGRMFCALFLIVIGGWYLLKDLGYLNNGVSLWPILLVFIGLWMIFKANRK